jgi:type II secretion system (T2SS) protein N
VKRGTLILTLIAGTLVFLAVLVLYLPASWFASLLPPQVRCASLGGSVWHGECLGLTVQGGKIGDATWNLSPLKALTGRLSGDVDVRGGAIIGHSGLDLGFDGSGELTGLDAQFPMDPEVAPVFPRGQRGLIVARFARLALNANAAPRAFEGSVELRDFRQTAPRPLELGSYRLTFDGRQQANGLSEGKLVDIGGPFAVDGKVTFVPPNNYVLQGFITGRTPEARDIVREITLGVPPDASGRSEFTFENSF